MHKRNKGDKGLMFKDLFIGIAIIILFTIGLGIFLTKKRKK